MRNSPWFLLANIMSFIMAIGFLILIPWVFIGTILAILDTIKFIRTKNVEKKKTFRKGIFMGLGWLILIIIIVILWNLISIIESYLGMCIISCGGFPTPDVP